MEKIKLKVDMHEVVEMKAWLRYINTKDLDQIVWTKNGEVIDISKELIEDFKYMGLNNTDFVDFYIDSLSMDD